MTYRRMFEPDRASSSQIYEELRQKRILAGARKLPEVDTYFKLRDQDNGIDRELARIELDIQQIDLDRQKAIADMQGVKLAAVLSKLESRRASLAESIQSCESGRQSFVMDVSRAKSAARIAIAAFAKKAQTEMQEEARQAKLAAHAAILAAKPLLNLLDEAAVADSVYHLAMTSSHGESLNEIIDGAISFACLLNAAKPQTES